MNLSPKKQIQLWERLKGSSERANFETLWQNASDYCNPEDSDVRRISTPGQRRSSARVTDVGIEARRGFANGVYGAVIGSGEFFKMDVDDVHLRDNPEVKRWFTDVNKVMHTELRKSNFDIEVYQAFGELSDIGTTVTWIEWYEGALNYRTQHIANTWIDVNARNVVNRVFILHEMRADHIIEEFGGTSVIPEDITKAAEGGSIELFNVVQHVFKNADYKEDSMNPRKRAYLSTYILVKDKTGLRTDGYDEFPLAVGRLYKTRNEIYGRSCYMQCQSTINMIQDERTTLIRSAKRHASPPWVESADCRTRYIQTNGETRVIYDPTALGGPPTQQVSKDNVGITQEMMAADTDLVNRAFLLDSFNPLADEKYMTAYETQERMAIGLSKTTPVLNNVNTYLGQNIQRSFFILQDKGKFPEPPKVLDGQSIKVDFISKANLALRQVELLGVMITVNRAIEMAAVEESVLDVIDFDEVIKLSAEVDNVPNNIIRTDEMVNKMRMAQAKQIRDQQAVDNANPVADADLKTQELVKGENGPK